VAARAAEPRRKRVDPDPSTGLPQQRPGTLGIGPSRRSRGPREPPAEHIVEQRESGPWTNCRGVPGWPA
jgi:hypothetical protein